MRERTRPATRRHRGKRVAAAAGIVALLVGTVLSAPIEQTEAAWVDHEIATAALSVASLPAVPNFACPSDGATFTWTKPPVPYPGAVLSGYEFSYQHVNLLTPATVVQLPATATGTSIAPNLLVLLASYNITLTAKYTNWVTPPATRTLHVVLELLGIKVFLCGA